MLSYDPFFSKKTHGRLSRCPHPYFDQGGAYNPSVTPLEVWKEPVMKALAPSWGTNSSPLKIGPWKRRF